MTKNKKLKRNLTKLIGSRTTQATISRRLRIPDSTLCDWVHGHVYMPSSDKFFTLAKYLKTNPTVLLFGKV